MKKHYLIDKIISTIIKCIFILLLMDITYYSNGQNLIPNPGFELHDTCPTGLSEFERVYFWEKVENTPDYYHSCEPYHISGIPYNYFGFQPAHSGCSYVGFVTYNSNDLAYREFIQVQLFSNLIIGTKYFVSFNINLCNGYVASAGTNKIGFKLSTQPYTIATDGNPGIDNKSIYYLDSIITDTLNWVTIKTNFIADSAYKVISFGNFFDSISTNYTILYGNGKIFGYYYLDDVCLSTDSLTCVNVTDTCHPASPLGVANLKANDLVVYPNPFSDYLNAENKNNNEELEIVLRDLDGRVLWREQFTGKWKRDLSYLANGMYFYEVRKQKKLVKAGKMVKV
jgi:hypothetical protein